MKYLIPFMIAGSLMAAADQSNIGWGPFSLELTSAANAPQTEKKAILDDKIGYAIASKQRIVLTLVTEELGKKGEKIATAKQVTLEPYILGLNSKGQPILRGNVVKVEEIKDTSNNSSNSWKGFFTTFKPGTSLKAINVNKISNIEVLSGDFFNPPAKIDDAYLRDLQTVKYRL